MHLEFEHVEDRLPVGKLEKIVACLMSQQDGVIEKHKDIFEQMSHYGLADVYFGNGKLYLFFDDVTEY